MYDVIVVGAGIAGAACARELARYELSVLVLEAGSDVASGATRANSGIVHGGYDPIPGTLKSIYNISGSRMYPALARDLGFSYVNNGSLVVAFSEEERPMLNNLMGRGWGNGVTGLQILESEELHAKEPNLSPAAVAALWVPSGAITNPYGACLALAENAAENGVTFRMDTKVDSVSHDGVGYTLVTEGGEHLSARAVINAAGINSGKLNNMVSDTKIELTPRAGEYELLDVEYGTSFTSTIFQTPTAAGKGVLIAPTTGGNLIIGPDALQREDDTDTSTTAEGLDKVLKAASKTWEHIPTRGIITNFAGLRASCLDHPDFILGQPDDAPGFFNICGFDSPGLTAAPAVAVEMARDVAFFLNADKTTHFKATRTATPRFAKASNEKRRELIAADPAYGRIVCRCECVSEAEIVAALHSPVPARTTDAIKWRTRAGMGRCQAGFCLPVIAQIMARELGCDVADVRKGDAGSELAIGHRGCLTDVPQVAGLEGGAQ